ncbi:hypothetical protein BH09PAT1_BH09PAT1_3060 [soil metagenome]
MDKIKNKQDEELVGDPEVANEVEQEEDSHDECEEKLQVTENARIRAIADYQNLEKRVREERISLIQSSNKELLLRFLPILDTLVLGYQHEENSTLKLVIDQYAQTLKSEGITEIKTKGEKFDPMTMEVVTTTKGKEGVVIQEVRTGYLLHDKLLRPAQVIVGNGEAKKASSN